jgi:hypothetical protein
MEKAMPLAKTLCTVADWAAWRRLGNRACNREFVPASLAFVGFWLNLVLILLA